jgi:hypothetical protein
METSKINAAANIRIYASLADVLTMSIGASFSSGFGQKELY